MSWLARRNPAAKILAALIISLGLLPNLRTASIATALGLEMALLPFAGLAPRQLWHSLRPMLFTAATVGIATAIFVPVPFAGLTTTMRVLTIAVPGVVLLAGTDPTDLADALAQNLRLPARFVLAALAALRLVTMLGQERETLLLARRARGLEQRSLPDRLRASIGQLFTLLVLALRRGTVLATTMESRGFGITDQRTWARQATFGLDDGLLLVGAAALVTTSLLVPWLLTG